MKLRVETSQLIGRPVEEVFEAWVDPRKMSGYFISSGSARMEAGGTVVWRWDDHGGMTLEVDVQTVEPGRQLTFDWPASGVVTRVAVEFEPGTEGTTEVTVRDGDWESDAEGIRRYGEQMQGWVHMLACLKAYLEYEAINLRRTASGPHGLETRRSMTTGAAEIYRAMSGGWGEWFSTPGAIRIEPKMGSPYWFDAVDEDEKRYPHYGRFLRLEQDRLVELTWVNEATRGAETRLKVELAPEGDGTLLRLAHTGFPDEATRDRYEAAWPEVLAYLDRHLAGEAAATP